MAALKARRSQEERSASTRARLLDATIDALYERGYARITTTEIARRAGLSRGAQLHHFPTKAELVTTAVEHLFQQLDHDFRAKFAAVPPAERAAAAVDILWSMVSGRAFYAWLELIVAARTDPGLHATVVRIAERFTGNVHRTFRELFAEPAGLGPFHDVAPVATFALLQGLALDRIVAGDDPRIATVLARFKMIASLVMTGTGARP